MSDPLRDERFPDRPQHPDFWRIANGILKNDGDTSEGKRTSAEITAELVDVPSLMYVAVQRSLGMRKHLVREDPRLRASMANINVAAGMASLVVDAFVAGAMFQKEGGHREE